MMREDEDVRLVLCEVCGSEGRIYWSRSGHQNDPDTIDCGPCGACDGTGRELIEVEPIELTDLDAALEADGEKLRALTGEDHGPWVIE